MKLVKYNPRLRNFTPSTFGSFVDQFIDDAFEGNATKNFIPRVDVAETDKEFEISFAVPGMKKNDFSVDFKDGQLTIGGERKIENEDKNRNFHTIETQYGSFSRTFYLPENIDHSKINASYKDGILNVVVPKDEKKVLKSVIEVK